MFDLVVVRVDVFVVFGCQGSQTLHEGPGHLDWTLEDAPQDILRTWRRGQGTLVPAAETKGLIPPWTFKDHPTTSTMHDI